MLAATLLSQDLSRHPGPAILWGHHVIGILESYGLRFDKMSNIHRLMKEQVQICK